MNEKKSRFKRILKNKWTWIILVIILSVSSYIFLKPNKNIKNTVTDKAVIGDLEQTVLATGQVVSNTDLDLSFNSSGIVKSIKVKVGDKVKKGQIIATLDSGLEQAALTSARGALAAAKARLNKIIDGASFEEISLSEISLANAKRDYENIKIQQETLVKNAYYNLLNSTPEAVPEGGISDYIAPTISGNYNLGKEGNIKINIYNTGNGSNFSISGITSGSGIITTITPQPLGDSGLYIIFPSTSNLNINRWNISIPNKQAGNYLINYNLYQAALKTQESILGNAQSVIDQRVAELAIKKSVARNSDIELANANILSAQGQVEQAYARYSNTFIKTPTEGTITRVDIKIGELAQAQKSVISLQDISNIYLETNINEANISNLMIGMPIDITYDSFGENRIFSGKITKIDPASTLVSGVVNYKVTASTEQTPEIKPGMTANMTIKVNNRIDVISIPSRAIIKDNKGNQSVRLITNTKKKNWKLVPITTGLEGDGGIVEVTKGLSVGDEYVVLIKK